MRDDAHARPRGSDADALYDLSVPTPNHAERARTLIEGLRTGTLCTLALDPAGYPYGSLVTFAASGGAPVFLISELAEHTRNLRSDARASLLVAESRASDPLANARVTLIGHCMPCSTAGRARVRDAYLQRHPDAGYYADFKDFAFWILEVSAVRYIGGYGRMSWVPLEEWRRAEPDPIASDAAAILEHMNRDHGDALPLYCRAFSRASDIDRAVMTSIDRLGFEMSVVTAAGARPVRVAFPEPIANKTQARQALVALLGAARAKLGIAPPRA